MKKLVAVTLLIAVLISGLLAEEIHVIAKLRFAIVGMTSAGSLARAVRLREGLEFPSAAALGDFLAEKRQTMLNLRVFSSVELGDQIVGREGNRIEHEVLVSVKDSFTLIPIPYVVYDSNSGLEIGAEIHYDNAFGTLTNWFLNPYVRMHERDGVYGVGAWKLNPRLSNLWIGKFALTFDINQERVETQMREDGTLIADYSYYLSAFGLSAELELGGEWAYTIAPRVEGQYGFIDYLGNGNFRRDRLGCRLTQDIEVGEIDWMGNFRKGSNAKFEHAISLIDRDGEIRLVNGISLTASSYQIFLAMNYYGRARALYEFNAEARNLGGELRGIPDSELSGIGGLFASQTLALELLRWRGKLDLQLHPFLDAGLALPKSRTIEADRDLKIGAGTDVALFIDAVSNLVLRATFGMDLGSSGIAEALGKMEIIVTTGLSY